jgi:hypothetical protein
MPAKADKVTIKDPFLDRRTKLLPCQREMVHYWYGIGTSIHKIAKIFKVNKRLIQFELFPERKKKNLEHRRDRGGTKIYYNKEKWREDMQDHREHKKKVLIDKDFKKDDKQ